MATLSCAQAVTRAMKLLGVLGAGEAATGNDLTDARDLANMMLGSWSVQSLTVPYVAREEFANLANVSTYTIGDGGDFDTERPSGQQNVVGAGLLLASSSPTVEIPRTIYTYAMYEGIRVKTLTNTLWTGLLYRPTSPLGTIILWPVPTQVNGIALYILKSLTEFADLTTGYAFPQGTDLALVSNLAVTIAPLFTVEPPQTVLNMAMKSFAAMKRNNYQMVDVEIDPMFTMQTTPGAYYNINTGGSQRG